MSNQWYITCNDELCDEKLSVDIYSLTLDKVCNQCNIVYKADKPWYYHCKDCNQLEYKKSKCFYCKHLFYKDVKILHIVSGSYNVPSNYNTRTFLTCRKLIPYDLRETERKIPEGTHFSKQVCFNHLSSANKYIANLSQE